MIKKYNQFVKENINNDMEDEMDMDSDMNANNDMDSEMDMDSDMNANNDMDSEMDMEDEMDSDMDMEDEMDSDMDMEDEEEGIDIYKAKMTELADLLGVEVDENNRIEFEGKEIIFPSETEMFHVDRKKFKTTQEVVEYLKK